jgi:hypothetical protein
MHIHSDNNFSSRFPDGEVQTGRDNATGIIYYVKTRIVSFELP